MTTNSQPQAARPEVLAAITTPFTADGLDLDTLARVLQRLAPHLDGVFLPGTTGEFPALSVAEYVGLWRTSCEVLGAEHVVAHVGAADIRTEHLLVAGAAELGITRFAAITPYYFRIHPDHVLRHYEALRSRVPAGAALYGYVFPDVAGNDLLPADVAAMAAVGLDGIKVSGAASDRVLDYLAAAPAGFQVWSGNDADLPRVLAAGGRGTVSGVSTIAPRLWAEFSDGWTAGDEPRWQAAQADIARLVPLLGPSISRLRYALELVGLPTGDSRMPVAPLEEATRSQIQTLLEELDLLATAPA